MSAVIDSLVVTGAFTAGSLNLPAGAVVNASVDTNAEIARSKLALETKAFDIPLDSWRIHDTLQPLPATSSGDDLGWYPGTYLTNAPLIRSADIKNTGPDLRMRTQVALPAEYVSAGTITLRFFAGMVTTVASSEALIDAEAAKITGATVGSDLVTTEPININSLTFGNKDFSVTASGLVAGDSLDIKVTISADDSATMTAVIAAIANTQILCQVRG